MDNEFKEYGFKVVRDFYDVNNHTKQVPNLFDYTKSIKSTGELDTQTPFAPSFSKNIEMNKVQIRILTKMEEATGLKLYPTYNYFRIYNKKSILKRHTDRPACEISVTMNVGFDGDYNWPICIKDKKGKEHSVVLEPGDGLVYLGCEQVHWREDADDRVICQSQVFIHYVNQDGPHADCIFDLIRYD